MIEPTDSTRRPIVLSANQPRARFYRGGARIADFRGTAGAEEFTPEDWVASTTSVRGQEPAGQTRLPTGELLADAVAASPADWLGPEHLAAFGADTMLLVKLLDAGQRLPVHAHPDGPFARRLVGTAHGKAEAWYLLRPGVVRLGLTRDIGAAELRAPVAAQDTRALLGPIHELVVEAGQTVFVPPGVLHAIGEDILLVEVQEPEDLSILLEWDGFELDGPADGHLGLGFEVALDAVETRARGRDEIEALVVSGPADGDRLPGEAARFFRLERVTVAGGVGIDPGFAVLITMAGELDIVHSDGERTAANAGSTVLLPHAAGPMRLEGAATALIARPPLPWASRPTRLGY